MNVAKKIFTKLNGLHYPQDYLCFAAETFDGPLRTYLVQDGEIKKDITSLHAFVGYCPVLFALPAFTEINESEFIEVAFCPDDLDAGEKWTQKKSAAFLSLKRIKRQQTGEGEIFYYEGVAGKHHFTSTFQQVVGQLYNRLYNNKAGNVFLKGNLHKQVQIAYCVPRKICLVTVGMNYAYNLFPTDLHGQVGESHYVVSLRHEGKACKQVLAAQNIVLSDVQASSFRTTYGLGKNHMQPLKDLSAFAFSKKLSALLHLPLPNGAVKYKELSLEDSLDAGIHKLLLFKITNTQRVTNEPETLVHVHNVYATWRRKKGLPGNYLLR